MQDMREGSNKSSENTSAYSDLKRRAQITRKTRFQASQRLERRQKASYFAISVLSLFVILMSLLPNIYDLTNSDEQLLLALTVMNSVFIIITTFLEASGNFVHKGEQLHRSARRVATVYNRLLLLSEEERDEVEKIRALQGEYQLALDECEFNHDNLDYFLVTITEPYLFVDKDYSRMSSRISLKFGKIQYFCREHFWLIPHAVVTIGSLLLVIDMVLSSIPKTGVN